jgi:hypothetical protein
METGAGRTTIRPAISGPLTTAASGLSRSLADTSPRRSGHRQCYRHVHDRTVERHQNCAEARINRTIPAAVSAHRLPGQLNLKLGAVILDLKFHFQMDLIGDVRDEPKVFPLDHDIIVDASSSAIACRRAPWCPVTGRPSSTHIPPICLKRAIEYSFTWPAGQPGRPRSSSIAARRRCGVGTMQIVWRPSADPPAPP